MTAKKNKQRKGAPGAQETSSDSTPRNQQGMGPGGGQMLLMLLAVALVLMVIAAFVYRIDNPRLSSVPRGMEAHTTAQAPEGMPPGGMPPGAMPPGGMPPGEMPPGGMPPSMAGGGDGGPMAMVRQLMTKLEQEPNNVEVLLMLGEQFMEMKAWDRAKKLLNKALVVKPDNIEALNLLGIIDYNENNNQEAANKFQMILEIEPHSVMAHFNLGVIYWRYLENPEKGREHLQAVIDSDNASAQAKENARDELAHLEKGE